MSDRLINILRIGELGDILNQVETIPTAVRVSRALFVSKTRLEPYDVAAILSCEEDFEEDDIKLLQRFGLVYLLELGLVHSIVEHAKWKRPNASAQDLVNAVDYYLDNDAFMHFD